MKHRVAVTVSEPDHPAVSMRKETKEKFVRVTADSKDEAVAKAKAHYKKQGYKVHGAEYHSELKESAKRYSDPVPSVYDTTSAETKGTYHIDYHGKDKDGNKQTKTYKLKANDNHHAQSKAMKIARSEFPHHVWRSAGTTKFFKEDSEINEQTPVAPVPGMKWKDYAVMVHKDSGKRVVIYRKNVGNYPEHEGWKEVAPGQKVRKEELEKFSDWIQEASCGSKTDMIKKVVKKMKEEVDLDEAKIDKEHPIVKEYDALKKSHSIQDLRALLKRQNRIVDTSEYRTKDHAISAYLRNKHGDRRVDQAFGFKEEVEQLEEATLAYHVKKASEAKERGDDKKFAYHMENARTARFAMTGKEMLRNRHHLDKYDELRDGK